MNASEMFPSNRTVRRAVSFTLLTATLAGGIAASSRGPGEKYSALQQRISIDTQAGEAPEPLSVQETTEVCGPGQYIINDNGGGTAMYGPGLDNPDGKTVAELTQDLQNDLVLKDRPEDTKYSIVIWTDAGQEPISLEDALNDQRVLINSADELAQDGVLMTTFSCGNLADLPDGHPYKIQQAQQDSDNH